MSQDSHGSTTGTVRDARRHARAQAGAAVQTMPTVPASEWTSPPPGVPASDLRWAETVAPGGAASKVLSRGTHLRLTDLDGGACAHITLHNADAPWERLNVADTVKIPWQAYLGPGHPLLSDQGRALATIIADDSGRHDAICGGGVSTRQAFVNLAAKHGLEPRDLPASISFFSGVRVQHDGSLTYLGNAGPGRAVTLRCELPVVVLIANVQHPLAPAEPESATPLEVLAWRGDATSPTDPLWSSTPELRRALENTVDYWEARS
jgi:uncharacterized protein